MMQVWLNKPYVHEWYDRYKQNTLEEITNRYSPKIKGEKPTDCYVALFDGKPFGYVQTYKVNDWPEFGDYVGYDDYTASIDLFIGEDDFTGKGFGSKMLHDFLEQVVFSKESKMKTCIIGPEPDNKRGIRAYEKVGFKYVKTIQIPGEDHPTYIMEMRKRL